MWTRVGNQTLNDTTLLGRRAASGPLVERRECDEYMDQGDEGGMDGVELKTRKCKYIWRFSKGDHRSNCSGREKDTILEALKWANWIMMHVPVQFVDLLHVQDYCVKNIASATMGGSTVYDLFTVAQISGFIGLYQLRGFPSGIRVDEFLRSNAGQLLCGKPAAVEFRKVHALFSFSHRQV